MRTYNRVEDSTEINITPMLDIVFIMLIFFIVTTSFVKESGIDVSRPATHSEIARPQGNLIIGISENGEIRINRRQVELKAVRSNVEKAQAGNPDISIVIRVEKTSATGILVQVMDQVKLAGINTISVATQK